MENIGELYKRANETQKNLITEGSKGIVFSNINKWSPADIYFASPAAKKQISDEVQSRKKMTFSILNRMISKMITEGQLLPLSLKKKNITILFTSLGQKFLPLLTHVIVHSQAQY